MNSLEFQLKKLTGLLSSLKIDYVVLGGIGVSIYGEPRLTLDIDINIMLDEEKIDDFLKEAKKYGFYPITSSIKRFVHKTGVIPMRFSKGKVTGICDFIIAENPIEYLSIRRGRFKKINSTKVKLVTPEDLIIHKITSSRPRDLEDVQGILMRQKGKLDIKYIKYWLEKLAKANHKPELLRLFESLLK